MQTHVLGCTGLRMGHADSRTGMYWSENGACIHVLGCTLSFGSLSRLG